MGPEATRTTAFDYAPLKPGCQLYQELSDFKNYGIIDAGGPPPQTSHMHEIQRKLLALAQELNLGQMSLLQIGALIDVKSAQKIKHHLGQLEKRGLIRLNRSEKIIERTKAGPALGLLTKAKLISIPIFGSANAGHASIFADQNIEGYLRISSTLLGHRAKRHLFALRVDGPSMNRAEIGGRSLEDGDYIIVDADAKTPRNGQIILSVIDGMANIKRFHRDARNKEIVLLSDSTHSFPPIHIHESDEYLINGTVVHVVKKQR